MVDVFQEHMIQVVIQRGGEICAIFFDGKEIANGSTFSIREYSSVGVRDPTVGSSSSREDPKAVFKAKHILQSVSEDFDGHFDKGPALLTKGLFALATTSTNVIIVIHINIEHELSFFSFKICKRSPSVRLH